MSEEKEICPRCSIKSGHVFGGEFKADSECSICLGTGSPESIENRHEALMLKLGYTPEAINTCRELISRN